MYISATSYAAWEKYSAPLAYTEIILPLFGIGMSVWAIINQKRTWVRVLIILLDILMLLVIADGMWVLVARNLGFMGG